MNDADTKVVLVQSYMDNCLKMQTHFFRMFPDVDVNDFDYLTMYMYKNIVDFRNMLLFKAELLDKCMFFACSAT